MGCLQHKLCHTSVSPCAWCQHQGAAQWPQPRTARGLLEGARSQGPRAPAGAQWTSARSTHGSCTEDERFLNAPQAGDWERGNGGEMCDVSPVWKTWKHLVCGASGGLYSSKTFLKKYGLKSLLRVCRKTQLFTNGSQYLELYYPFHLVTKSSFPIPSTQGVEM